MSSGLRVTVISAFNLPKKAGFMDKTDPYVQIQVGAQKAQTSTKVDAGSEAQYNETLHFSYNGEPYIMVHVFDEEKKKDDLLGSGKLDLSPALMMQGWRGVIQVFNKKEKQIGDVLIHVQGY